MTHADRPAAWRENWAEAPGSPWSGRPEPSNPPPYRTLTYEQDGRVARITFNRPRQGNAITVDTPFELAHAVERADLDPRVHVILLSGRGKGFCGGYDLSVFAEGHEWDAEGGRDRTAGTPDAAGSAGTAGSPGTAGTADGTPGNCRTPDPTGTVVDPVAQAANHDPRRTWDPMVDYAMMSRFTKGFASLLHADKPTVAKLHGFCVAGGTDIALHCDQIVCADDTKIGYPPTRVWGVPSAGMWAHRLGDQRAKRLLLTGDCVTGRQAAEWGLAAESWPAEELDVRTEELVGKIAMMPVNQLMMVKLALNSALLAQGVANSAMVSTVFDGVARHTREGYAFAERAATVGFRQAVRERDEPFGDHKRAPKPPV